MAVPQKKGPKSVPNTTKPSVKKLTSHDAIQTRVAREIVIGLCGPIGSGIKSVESQLIKILEEECYQVSVISVSSEIERFMDRQDLKVQYDSKNKYSRYESLMDAGNVLRKKFQDSICADLAITKKSDLRCDTDGDEDGVKNNALEPVFVKLVVAITVLCTLNFDDFTFRV